MLSLLSEGLSAYVEDHATPEPALLTELRAKTQASLPDPQMQVGRVEGALLKLLVQISGATQVLEVGTYSGYSALSLASGLPADGRLITCDLDPVATAVAREFFARSEHGHKIELRLGPATDTIDALVQSQLQIDLVFLDADKEGYVGYYDQLVPALPAGALLIADNTLWGGHVLQPQDASDHGIVDFNRRVAQDPRVEQVLLPVRDGVTLVRKR